MPKLTNAKLASLLALAANAEIRNRLLVDLVASPVALRGDRHGALVRSLMEPPATSPGELLTRLSSSTAAADDDEEEEVWPWEESLYTVENGVAVLPVNGPLLKGYDAFVCWWYGYFSVDRLQEALAEIATRADVAAVVFRFGSPGGIVTGIPETAQQIAALEQLGKVTVAFTDTMACSAAYWLACHCGTFLATPSADVGSIGTYIALYDRSEMLKSYGIKLELFRRGKYKGIGVMGKKLTPEERAFIDADVGRTNDRFTSAVRARRGEVDDETMQGQWFDGEEAHARNLVDAVAAGFPGVLANLRGALSAAIRGAT